jgi:hypothetical protein
MPKNTPTTADVSSQFAGFRIDHDHAVADYSMFKNLPVFENGLGGTIRIYRSLDEDARVKFATAMREEFGDSPHWVFVTGESESSFWATDTLCVMVENELYETGAMITFAKGAEKEAREVAARIGNIIDALKTNQGEENISVSATYLGNDGMEKMSYTIQCPSWEEIRANYSEATGEAIDRLLGCVGTREAAGRLVIFSGAPGTGKTYAIKAIVRELVKRMNPAFVLDPDAILGDPSYLYALLHSFNGRDEKSRPTLIVMEDAIRPLLEESRTDQGSPVSRLLNMTDGILTKTRQDSFIVTFNEAINKLDEAILRPGRCLARIEFPPLTEEHAQRWMASHGVGDKKIPQPTTLAALYAMLGAGQIVARAVPGEGVGF